MVAGISGGRRCRHRPSSPPPPPPRLVSLFRAYLSLQPCLIGLHMVPKPSEIFFCKPLADPSVRITLSDLVMPNNIDKYVDRRQRFRCLYSNAINCDVCSLSVDAMTTHNNPNYSEQRTYLFRTRKKNR